jgi:hypothetical protein
MLTTKTELDAQEREEKDSVYMWCRTFADEIEDVLNGKNGLSSWFEAYIASDAFTNLDTESRKTAFQLYENISCLFRHLEELRLEQL